MAYTKDCVVCGEKFDCKQIATKFCSSTCRNKNYMQKRGIGTYNEKVAPSTIGAVSELIVAADLMKKGYFVFRALSTSSFCDLIAFKDEKTMYVEVRTGYKGQEIKIVFGKRARDGVTHYGVYERNTGDIFYFGKNGIDEVKP